MKYVKELFAALVVALMLPAAASAGLEPHDATNDVVCESCHTSHESLGSSGYDNMCLTCHKTGSASKAKKFPFAPGDAANPFRTYTSAQPSGFVQTSHTWVGSEVVGPAGASRPTDIALNKSNIAGFLTCVKCHNIHAPRSSATNSAPFLRTLNDKDQMCLDCHRARNTKDHRKGTHPVLVSYTGSALRRAKPAEFNLPPVNANPANPTSDVKFVANTVGCSTCHRVHYGDSNSATFDSRTSVLAPSTGYLLRSDYRGATSAAVNICTSCHKKPNHNKNGQDVQCNDCHAGHVDTNDGSTPNVYIVRRFMNISTQYGAVRNKKAFYQSTSSKNWLSSNGAKPGVCEACHVVPTGGVYPPEHSIKDNGKVCMSCHVHNSTAGAFSANCNLCHGYPPQQNVAAGPMGYASESGTSYATSGKFKNEAATPHKVHAGGAGDYSYGCGQCHKGNSHNNGATFQDVFISTAGTIAATAGATPAYNGATTGSCSSVYCHSNGAPRNASLTAVLGAPLAAIPAWDNGAGKLAGTGCSSCHNGLPNTNAHMRHVSSMGYNCGVCHAGTVGVNVDDFSTIVNKSAHADGVKTVVFNPAHRANGTTWNNASATCTTSACHDDGRGNGPVTTPKWVDASTGACGTCHRALAPSPIATYAHTTHLSAGFGPQMGTAEADCKKCHDYVSATNAKHVNGTINVLGTACTTCHPNGFGGQSWTAGNHVDCTTCHAATPSVISSTPAPYKSLFSSKGHGQAFTNYTASRRCESCHDRNSAHINGSVGDTRLLLANDNTQCASCHTNATKVPTVAKRDVATHVRAAEYQTGSGTMPCKDCHDVHGTTNRAMIKSSIGGFAITFTNTSSGFVDMVTHRGLCQVCHTQTNHFKAGVAEAAHPTKNCLQCHKHKDSVAFKPNGTCDACHGYPPVANMTGFGVQGSYTGAKLQDYANGGGPHTKPGHIKPTAKPTEGWENCKACHSGGSLTPATHTMTIIPAPQNKITINIDPALLFTSNHNATYSGPLNGSNTTGSCSNVACHFKPTPVWAP